MQKRRFLTEDGKKIIVDRAFSRGWKKYSEMAGQLGIQERQFFNLIGGSVAVSPKVKRSLQEKFGFSENEVERITMSTPSLRKFFAAETARFGKAPRGVDEYYMQLLERTFDQRNVISDSRISEMLWKTPCLEEAAAQTPSLAECITVTELAWFREASEKDTPQLGLFEYNHFFHIACIIRFCGSPDDRDPEVLLYDRGSLRYERSPGESMVWYTSYMYHGLGHVTPMERWIQAVRERLPNAGMMMTAGQVPLLIQLMRCRIDLNDFQIASIYPFGVITSDQRDKTKKCRRIYTEYVFVVDLHVEEEIDKTDLLANISCNGVPLRVMRQSALRAEAFERRDNEPAVTDILAWRALQSTETLIVEPPGGHFRRGFRLF